MICYLLGDASNHDNAPAFKHCQMRACLVLWELTRPGRRQVKLLLSRVSGKSRGARILKAVDFIAGQLQLARRRHHRSEKLARHAVLHLRLAERSRWLNERPKKNRYSQTKIDVPQPHGRRGLAAEDDQLLTQDDASRP